MSEEFEFMNKMREHPEDSTIRLVYADWLDEHGRGKQAEFVRLQCEIAALGLDRPSSAGNQAPTHRCPSCRGYWRMLPQNWTVRRHSGPPAMRIGDTHWQAILYSFCEDCIGVKEGPPRVVPLNSIALSLLGRQSAILSAYNTSDGWREFQQWIRPVVLEPLSGAETWFRFGSLDRLTCTFQQAVAWLPELVRRHPLRPETLSLTDLLIHEGDVLVDSVKQNCYIRLHRMAQVLPVADLKDWRSKVRTGFPTPQEAHQWMNHKLFDLALKSKL